MLNKLSWNKLLLSATVCFLSYTSLAQQSGEEEGLREEVIVTGVRQSLQDALSAKRDAAQIVDSIVAEDIGKLPDNNVAEAMQRVTGIQITRNPVGAGEAFQVRGLSQNRVEVNGRTLASSNDGSNSGIPGRSNTLDGTSSALIKGIKVFKSPTADMIEGSIGATVRLETFKPLDFNDTTTLNLSAEGIDYELNDDTGILVKGLAAHQLDVGEGRLGVMLNVSYLDDTTNTDLYTQNFQPLANNQYADIDNNSISDFDNFTVFRPTRGDIDSAENQTENEAVDLALQWQVNEDLQFFAQAIFTDNTRIRDRKKFTVFANRGALRLTDWELVRSSYRSDRVFADNMGAPFIDNVNMAILSRGTVSVPDGANLPANQNQVEATGEREERGDWSKSFAFEVDWNITERLNMKLDVSSSTSHYDRVNQFTTFNPRFFDQDDNDIYIDLSWDYTLGTTLPSWTIDYSPVIAVIDEQNLEPLQLDNGELVDERRFAWNQIGGRFDDREGEETAVALDFDFDLNDSGFTSLEFGARFSEYTLFRDRTFIRQEGANSWANWNLHSIFSAEWTENDGDPNNNRSRDLTLHGDMLVQAPELAENFFAIPDEDIIFKGFSGGTTRRWPVVTKFDLDFWFNTLDTYFPGRAEGPGPDGDPGVNCTSDDPMMPPSAACADNVEAISGWELVNTTAFNFDLSETTYAIYTKANFEFDVGIPLTGNAGVRVVQTKFDGDAFDDTINASRNATQDYTNILPSINLNFELREDIYLRAAAAKNIARATPQDIVPSRDQDNNQQGEKVGNPDLEPEEVAQFDISLEWYINADTALSGALFKKNLKNFQKDNITIIENFDLDGNPATTDDIVESYEIRSRINAERGEVKGIELSYQQVFSTLPGAASGLGMLVNYTYTDSNQSSGFNQWTGEDLPVNALSERSSNIILFWEKYGFSLRAAYNWRDSYYSRNTARRAGRQGLSVVDELNTEATGETQYATLLSSLPDWEDEYGQIDLSASYQFENGITIFANALDFNADPKRRTAAYPGSPFITRSNYAGTTYRFGIKSTLGF